MHGRLPVNSLVSGTVPSSRCCLRQLKGLVVWLPQEERSGGEGKRTDFLNVSLMPESPPSSRSPSQLPSFGLCSLPAPGESRAHPCDPLELVPLRSAPGGCSPALLLACSLLGSCILPLSVLPHSHSRWKSEHPGQKANVSRCPNSRGLGPGKLISRRYTVPLHPFFTHPGG